MSTLNAEIYILANTSANFTASNFTLGTGRFALETDTGLLKCGANVPYNNTGYINPARKRAVTVFVSGKPLDGELLWRDVVTSATAFTITANSTECVANAATAATGAPSINVLKNGTSVGNLTWSANATTGTISIPSNVTFTAGDVRSLVANSTADATLANISITLAGSI